MASRWGKAECALAFTHRGEDLSVAEPSLASRRRGEMASDISFPTKRDFFSRVSNDPRPVGRGFYCAGQDGRRGGEREDGSVSFDGPGVVVAHDDHGVEPQVASDAVWILVAHRRVVPTEAAVVSNAQRARIPFSKTSR